MVEEGTPATDSPVEVEEKTTCCIVGGGPAGMVLGLLLARDGIDVTVLESHGDFARDFRGDTFHASSLELMRDLGLLDKLEPLIHAKVAKQEFVTESGGTEVFARFDYMRSPFPYVAIIPQAQFLDFIAKESKKCAGYRLVMKANAQELLEEEGRVVGVRYQHEKKNHQLRAHLVIGADGRGSRMRHRAGIELETSAPPMDVVWFRLPRREAGELDGVEIRIVGGSMLVVIDRGDFIQCGYVIIKGSLKGLRAGGIEGLHQELKKIVPLQFHDRIPTIASWKDVSILAVQVGHVEQWYKPGLLLIGDAAHVMSPVGGVGINYAIQDSVAAFNLLADKLKATAVTDADLAAVQKRREKSVRVMQTIQGLAQQFIISKALNSGEDFKLPSLVRTISKIPGMRDLPAKMLAYGHNPERLERIPGDN